MEMRKEFEFHGYKFTVGILDNNNYTVGLLVWPGLKSFTSEELKRYRYVMFQAQREIDKFQANMEETLRYSLLGS